MKITINIPDKVFETCKEDEYFKMRVDFNASGNTIESITIDDGYELTKADFAVVEQPTETDKMSDQTLARIHCAISSILRSNGGGAYFDQRQEEFE